eukprot:7002369-Ditylum_brightwellii.AAC.1
MEEMRISSKKHKKKKATPTKISATPTSLTPSSGPSTPSRFLTVKQGTDKILGGIATIRKEDHNKGKGKVTLRFILAGLLFYS